MGRHSRKGAAPAPAPAAGQQRPGPEPGAAAGPAPGTGRRRRSAATTTADGGQDPAGPRPGGTQAYGRPPYGSPSYGSPAQGGPAYGTPAHGTPVYGTPAHGVPVHGAPARDGQAHGTPAHGTPAHGTPVYGTPAHGVPAYGVPGTPAHGVPVHRAAPARGGHPQHDEGGARPAPYGGRRGRPPVAEPEQPEQAEEQGPFVPAPRHEDEPDAEAPAARGGLGRTFAGVGAAAVATVLAVVVAGQVADKEASEAAPRAAGEPAERAADDSSASRSDDRITPTHPAPPALPKPPAPTYEQLMTHQFPIDPGLKGSGAFEAVQGFQKAPGKGRLIRYRVDVEKGLGLDPKLFADAVQKTLNDPRSWAGDGAMTFERISGGEAQFVITLASPGTTGVWCRKSGLDTTVDNVSCDSASTERVMINAFRWAQGADTFGPKAMYAYRQMLINHEVGHRLGHNHMNCRTPGALAPVMQQQTKSLDIDGVRCRPNPWVHPGS
ncbi:MULTISPECIES: DUF3152 domain-containing protein [unclassified Streptomyces]|uniref:DUF3152 domain-containing protein n=1 Tax=unclassified Streptomyces TaxID=2593676 RepID=UPI0035DC1863